MFVTPIIESFFILYHCYIANIILDTKIIDI